MVYGDIELKLYENVEEFIKDKDVTMGVFKYGYQYREDGPVTERRTVAVKGLSKEGIVTLSTDVLAGSYCRGKEGISVVNPTVINKLCLNCYIDTKHKYIFCIDGDISCFMTGTEYVNYNIIGIKDNVFKESIEKAAFNYVKENYEEFKVKYQKELEDEFVADPIVLVKNNLAFNKREFSLLLNYDASDTLNKLNIIYKCLDSKEYYDKVVMDFVKENELSVVKAYYCLVSFNEAMDKLKANPPHWLIDYIAISKAIETICPNANALIAHVGDEKIKIKNMVYDFNESVYFSTYNGWDRIYLQDINKITYGRTVICSREK